MPGRPHLPVTPANAGVSRLGSRRPARRDTGSRWHDGVVVGALFAACALAACSPASEPGAVTADEAHQLNEAAAMLDANSVDLNAVAAAPDDAVTDTETPSNQSDQTR